MRLVVLSHADHRQHRTAQRFRATDLGICFQFGHRIGDDELPVVAALVSRGRLEVRACGPSDGRDVRAIRAGSAGISRERPR